MPNCQIRFQHFKEDIIIDCQRNELMRDILNRYEVKSRLPANEFYFLYDGGKINSDLTLTQINAKDSEIKIVVYPKENENNMKQLDYIKCDQCLDPALIKILSDYQIALSDEKHGIKKIKLQDFNRTQIVDKSKIKVDSLKYFKCIQHQNNSFVSYCLNCKKNLCNFCLVQHEEHNLINYNELFQKQEKNEEIIEKIRKVNELVDIIIDSLQKFKENLDVYRQIIDKLNENLLNMNINYSILKSVKNLMEISFLKKDIDQILNSKDINEKFKKIMSIYEMMNSKANDVINPNHDQLNEIELKIKIGQVDNNKPVYFLDNTEGDYIENGEQLKHKHDNLKEINESNTNLIIDGKTFPFNKSFIPQKNGIY